MRGQQLTVYITAQPPIKTLVSNTCNPLNGITLHVLSELTTWGTSLKMYMT